MGNPTEDRLENVGVDGG